MARLEDTSIFDIRTVDKSNFVCVKFPDSSMYYGEMAYFDQAGQLVRFKRFGLFKRWKTTKNPFWQSRRLQSSVRPSKKKRRR